MSIDYGVLFNQLTSHNVQKTEKSKSNEYLT